MTYNINNRHFDLDIVDFTNSIPLEFNLIYDLNGAHGNKGRMILYASVEIYPLDIKYYQRYFVIKLHSLYWNKYKLTNGQCCSTNTSKSCENSCGYSVEFFISGEDLATYGTFLSTKVKETHLYLYTVFTEDAPNSNYNISIVISESESENDQIIDIANINPEEYSSLEAFLGINLQGKYDNVHFIQRYVSNRYTSPFHINKCHAIHNIEYCDYKTGNRHCINGAEDIDCERNSLLV
ncbi:hypothetical protein HZS_5071 [Henneguya salminicola]|nr:hypothetical protein HZS_5071 [Henneguya salminicola]